MLSSDSNDKQYGYVLPPGHSISSTLCCHLVATTNDIECICAVTFASHVSCQTPVMLKFTVLRSPTADTSTLGSLVITSYVSSMLINACSKHTSLITYYNQLSLKLVSSLIIFLCFILITPY